MNKPWLNGSLFAIYTHLGRNNGGGYSVDKGGDQITMDYMGMGEEMRRTS